MSESRLIHRDHNHLLGPALHLLRQRLNEPQRAIADRAGITHASYSAFERGRRTPNFEMLVRLLSALQADLSTLDEAIRSVQRLAPPPAPRRLTLLPSEPA